MASDPVTEIIGNLLANSAPTWFGDPTENLRRQDAIYADALDQQRKGIPLKDQGYNPKQLETLLGSDRAAHLYGYEKTDEFANRVQNYQNYTLPREQLTAHVSSALAHQLQYEQGPGNSIFQGIGGALNLGGAPAIANAALTGIDSQIPATAPGQSSLAGHYGPDPTLAGRFSPAEDYGDPSMLNHANLQRAGLVVAPGASGVATAALTPQDTNVPTQPLSEAEVIRRTAALPPYLSSLALGEAGKARQAEVTGETAARQAAVAEKRLPIEQQRADAATNANALSEQELKDRIVGRRQTFMNDALKSAEVSYPDLTAPDRVKVAKYLFSAMQGEPDESILGPELASRPGVVRSAAAPGQITPAITYKRLNEALKSTPAFVQKANADKTAANFDQPTLDAQDNADFRNVVTAARDHLVHTTNSVPTEDAVLGLIQDQVTFRRKLNNGKLAAVTWDKGLTDEEKAGKRQIIRQILRAPAPAPGTGGPVADLTNEYSNRQVGEPASAATATTSSPTPGQLQGAPSRGYNYSPPVPIPRGQ